MFFATFVTSCSKKDDTSIPAVVTNEMAVDASAQNVWHYYSMSQNKIIGTGGENSSDNVIWFKRSDWDFALNRYYIRTNCGTSTTASGKGGIYTCDASTSFSSVTTVPSSDKFQTDKIVAVQGMNGTKSNISMSDASSILFKKNEDGSLVMPPVYLQAPVYIIKSADGGHAYKVLFTQYKDESGKSGMIKFSIAAIE